MGYKPVQRLKRLGTRTCIICRQEKNIFNKEHIFPESIGGKYIIKSVCYDCNSNMGAYVDSCLTNDFLIQIKRKDFRVSSQKGHIPDPLLGIYILSNGVKIKVERDINGEYIAWQPIPTKKLTEDRLEITVSQRNIQNLESLIENELKRYNIQNATNLTRNNLKNEQIKIEPNGIVNVSKQLEFDYLGIGLAILKIAYEFAVDQLEDYYEDNIAIIISEILLNANREILKNSSIFIPVETIYKELKGNSNLNIDNQDENHYIAFLSSSIGLVCYVNIFNAYQAALHMSGKNYIEHNHYMLIKNPINTASKN